MGGGQGDAGEDRLAQGAPAPYLPYISPISPLYLPTSPYQVMIASMKEHRGPVNFISIKADDSECMSASADGSCINWSP